jgi:hypothetical protein
MLLCTRTISRFAHATYCERQAPSRPIRRTHGLLRKAGARPAHSANRGLLRKATRRAMAEIWKSFSQTQQLFSQKNNLCAGEPNTYVWDGDSTPNSSSQGALPLFTKNLEHSDGISFRTFSTRRFIFTKSSSGGGAILLVLHQTPEERF